MILLDRFVKIMRLSQTSGNRTGYSTFTTSLQATVQPQSAEKTASLGGSFGKMFVIYMDSYQDVQENDQLQDYEGNIYQPISGGVERRTDGFMADYLKVTAKKINP